MKRNITIALDEATARWARVEAARNDTSVSDFLGSILRERMAGEARYDQAMEGWMRVKPVNLKKAGKYPAREEVHERRRIR
jgi:plasmid stability protein